MVRPPQNGIATCDKGPAVVVDDQPLLAVACHEMTGSICKIGIFKAR
jgi:hypothetical protein